MRRGAQDQRRDLQVLLDPGVIRELAESIPGFDRAGLLAAIIDGFGGQRSLGKAIVQEFQHAKAGSITRARIIDLICRMLSQHSNVTQLRPVEEMDTDEIHHAILGMVPHLERITVDTPPDGSQVGADHFNGPTPKIPSRDMRPVPVILESPEE